MDKVSFGSQFGDQIIRPGGLLGRLALHGNWVSEGESPILVSDPDQARAILARNGIFAPKRLEQGLLSMSEAKRLLGYLARRSVREMEGLLSGGRLLWREEWANLVVDAGVTYILDAGLSGGAPITSWFVLPIQAASTPSTSLPTIAAGNTMASHAGWAEVTAYTEATREAWVEAGVSAKTVTNTASPAEFTINANNTYVSGGALASNSTKGGTTGTLYAAGAFAAVRTLNNTEIHRITAAMGG